MTDTYPFDSNSNHEANSSRITAVFNHWVETCRNPGRPPVLDDRRRRKIRNAIISHGANMCFLAIDGCKMSPFHQGQNQRETVYDEITLILRDAEHIEQFVAIYDEQEGDDAWIAANS